ncbi:MAG: hypothetical protein IJI98_10930 [Methanosphaera sp.]|nr:hypothetical protein [Methanobrevibacter sp.]MBQ6754190.1 hypothetical protein [Bacteroidales bacterium]MBR0351306.1 hypothetical protein [Clostridia bacterium]MBR0473192.1 hypothetical protein [Methanosphaera sp.]
MLAEEVFRITMAMIDEMTTAGELNETTTAEYRAKAPSILSMLQAELIGIENRYRDSKEQISPVPIESLDQPLQIDVIKATTLLTNGLAANLMVVEDKTLASFFEQRYEEMKGLFLKPKPRKPETRRDVYDSTLNY